jgi:hypothetical protein
MPVSDVLQNFRKSGYASEPDSADSSEEKGATGPRSLALTDEEVKSLAPYQANPGEEIVLEVTGRLEGNHFRVMSAKYAQGPGSEDEDAQKVAQGMGVSMRDQLP